MKKVLMSLGLLTALLVGGAISTMAAGSCCDPVKCCKADCKCPCCK